MTVLQSALSLARQGFHVFPLAAGSKTPIHRGWQLKATRDAEQIERWFRGNDSNVGIFTGKYGDDAALLVVDVDQKGAKHGNRSLLQLELEGKDTPPTFEGATPTGGRHLVYRVPVPVRQGADVLGDGLDIRSHGGYIVAPGSKVEAGEYFIDRPGKPVDAPQWLVEACGAPRGKAADRTPLKGVDADRATKRAILYLDTEAPEAIEGAGGDTTTFIVAAKLKDLGVPADEAVQLMLDHWHDGCGWTPEDLATKVRNAYKYGENPPGADAPEALFDAVEEPVDADAPRALHPFDRINQSWAMVMTGGGHHMLWETTDAEGNPIVEHVKESTFHAYLAQHKFQVGKQVDQLTKAWMMSDRRRTYDGLVFAPEQKVNERWYNLWRGFDFQPAAGGSTRAQRALQAWLDHCKNNVCGGDAKLAHWFVGYMAHIVQRPYEKPLVTLVLKGKKGTGKNAAVERVGALFSRNLVVADDDRYLVGNFNSHLEACLLLVLDEASWAGSKKVEGRLKGITTGRDHMIERKGMEPYKVRNLTRVVIIGNEDWLVPASADERRYAVFNVGEGSMQNREFFKEMREGMEAGGYALLLHYLQNFDLATVDVNDAPKTAGLADQKIESLSPQHQWWLDCLTEGQILGGDFAGEWPERIATNRLQEAAKRHNVGRGVRSWQPTVIQFNRSMEQLMPGWKAAKTSGDVSAGDKTYHYNLPPLALARRAMAEHLGKPDLFPEETL